MAPVVAEVLQRADLDARVQTAASSTLANQIMRGASASIFLSAHSSWMDELEAQGLLQPGTRWVLAGNELVLVTPKRAAGAKGFGEWADMAAFFAGRLSIGDPDHVPAGHYAKQALQALGLWEQLQDRLAPAIDARAALAAVEIGALELGVVYRSDALASDLCDIVAEFPAEVRPTIRYEMALLVGAPEAALATYRALIGELGEQVLAERGFLVLPR